MMISHKMFHWINKIALVAVLFSSLAPSISHALAAQHGVNSFVQEICTANGESVTIQVVSSQGKQLDVEQKLPAKTNKVISHFNHCPFCNNPNVNTLLEPPLALIFALRPNLSEKVEVISLAVTKTFSSLPPPAQAPPSL